MKFSSTLNQQLREQQPGVQGTDETDEDPCGQLQQRTDSVETGTLWPAL